MRPVVDEFLANATPASTEKVKLTKKTSTGKSKGTTKEKADKISTKNAYHVFVAAKMGQVKGDGVDAKKRMGAIGELWKALTADDKAPYEAYAKAYNEYVQAAQNEADWKSRVEEIKKAGNAHAQSATGIVTSSSSAASEDGEDEAVPETPAPVQTPAPAKPAPVVATPAPVAAAAAPIRKATKAKGK